MEKIKFCAIIVLLVTVIGEFVFARAVTKDLQQQESSLTEVVEEIIKKGPRCGVPDSRQSHIRKRRYNLGPSKWNQNTVTWNFDRKYSRHSHESDRIRTIIHNAVSDWQRHIPLQIIEVAADVDADIKISFEEQYHPNVDPYHFNDNYGVILGHAFEPQSGLGGDIHFREEVDWDFDWGNSKQQLDGRYSFYPTALHELGHSLGLDHSYDEGAVMYGSYTDNMRISYDDIAGIQHIYGFTDAVDEGETQQEFPDNSDAPPDSCNTSYDAVALVRGELFIFKGTYLWRAHDDYESAIKINQMWPQLPDNLRNVDAVYENGDGKIMIFVGEQVFVFDATTYEHQIALNDLGIHRSVRKIDAIFKWAFNRQTYIFSGNEYWRFDERTYRVHADYPKRIDGTWRDVYNIDTAFTYNNRLYFFKGINYYEFDDWSMQMKRMRPYVSAYFWMKCSIDRDSSRPRLDGGNERNGDFIRLGLEEEDPVENVEKFVHQVADEELAEGDASRSRSTNKLNGILFIASLLYLLD